MILYRKMKVNGETVYRIAEPRDIIRAHTKIKNKPVIPKVRKYIQPPRKPKPQRQTELPDNWRYEDVKFKKSGAV